MVLISLGDFNARPSHEETWSVVHSSDLVTWRCNRSSRYDGTDVERALIKVMSTILWWMRCWTVWTHKLRHSSCIAGTVNGRPYYLYSDCYWTESNGLTATTEHDLLENILFVETRWQYWPTDTQGTQCFMYKKIKAASTQYCKQSTK